MASATFNANLLFTPPESNSVSRAFNVELDYSAISIATVEVAASSTDEIEIKFGGATNAHGIVVKNNLDVDVLIFFNEGAAASYAVASGGQFMQFAPRQATDENLKNVKVKPAGTGPSVDGTVDYIVLGE